MSVEGQWPKVIRAEEHFAAVRSEVDFYREGDPYSAIARFDTQGWYRVREGST